MVELLDIIKNHIDNQLACENNMHYIGILKEEGPLTNQKKIENHILLYREEYIIGEIIKMKSSQLYELAFPCGDENYRYKIYPKEINLLVSPLDITKNEPIIQEAVTKEDWIESEPYSFNIKGDHQQHIIFIQNAIKLFRKDKLSELWLPSFIPCTY